MASILDVAKYILEKQGGLSTWKLQKLCYYSQAWTLAWGETPIFNEDFQAWANGAVCLTLFSIHKNMFTITKDAISDDFGVQNLKPNEIENIDIVLEYYGDKDGYWLTELIHKERPWMETRMKANVKKGEPCNEIISKDLMYDYYSGL